MDKLIAAIVAGAIGGSITIIGWVVTDLQYRRRWRREAEQRQREHEREATCRYIERQIEELYGPLAGLIRYSKHIYNVATTILPNKDDPEGGTQTDTDRFEEKHWDAWHFLTETYFHPINAQVRELLSTKMHLLEGETIPSSFEDFLEHTAHYEGRYKLAQDRNMNTIHIPGRRYPRRFQHDVAAALDRLKKRHDECLRSIGIETQNVRNTS